MRDSVVFYRSYYEIIKELPNEQKLKLYEAIFEYAYNDNDIELEGILQGIKNLIKPNIDSANARYEASVENGKKGGRPKKENLEKPSNNLDKTPRLYLGYENEKPRQNLNDNDNDNDNVNDNVVVGATAAPASDPVMTFYLNNINSAITPNEADQIRNYQNELPNDLIVYAMEKAVDQKKRNLAYIKAILSKWQAKGITTLAEAKEEKRPREETTKNIADLNRYRSDKEIDYDQFYWQG